MGPDAAGSRRAWAADDTEISVHAVDVGDQQAVRAAVEAVETELGPIWLLVNNAGWDKPTPFLQTDSALWEKIVRINLYGPLNTHHAVCPLMAERRGGRIVNIASDARGWVPVTRQSIQHAREG